LTVTVIVGLLAILNELSHTAARSAVEPFGHFVVSHVAVHPPVGSVSEAIHLPAA
jgi:hypothetical protein